ncbi:MAG: hypothetical protein HQL13_07480 [Candidatus Omnitrophica bacterium]|nr:hypothetical protein [Candidatus Omnitrophota bacterium]
MVVFILILAFLVNTVFCPVISVSFGASPVEFSVNQLPLPGVMVGVSKPFVPVLIKGLVVHPDKPFYFDFIVDSGNVSADPMVVKKETERIAQYFLGAITVPEREFWVNLSPYEKGRIMPKGLSQTVLGRDMLAQDYLLKQLSSSLMYPEKGPGKFFWQNLYKEAAARLKTTDVPVESFNKVWIMPQEAQIFEHGQGVYVTKARLKVMLDADYNAIQKNRFTLKPSPRASILKQMMQQIIIPAIEKEVNEGENFATIRQIYHAAILAKWYRQSITHTLMADFYIGKNKIEGIDVHDKALKEKIYARYISAYKKGVFNYIKEANDLASGNLGPRKYFAGGVSKFDMSETPLEETTNREECHHTGSVYNVTMAMKAQDQNSPKVITDILYPDADAQGLSRPGNTTFVNLPGQRLVFRSWPQRTGETFSKQEMKKFNDPNFKSERIARMSPDRVLSIRQSVYDRSEGDVQIWAVIKDVQGRKHYYYLRGKDTTAMEQPKELMPNISDLEAKGASFIVSLGNQADLMGNFTVTSEGDRWRFFGASNEEIEGNSFYTLVQFKDGHRALGVAQFYRGLEGQISRVSFSTGKTKGSKALSPRKVDFVFVAYPLLWPGTNAHDLLKKGYTETSDLRHLFRFPFLQGMKVFHDQVAQDHEKFDKAFRFKPVEFTLESQGETLERFDLEKELNGFGYVQKEQKSQVLKPGDYYIEKEKIQIVLLPARYPLSTLVVGENQELALVSIQGKSSRLGADYWTVGQWIKRQVLASYGWQPLAVFALDNGLDPYIKECDSNSPLVKGGRENFNAAFSFVPMTENIQAAMSAAEVIKGIQQVGSMAGLHTWSGQRKFAGSSVSEIVDLANQLHQNGIVPVFDNSEALSSFKEAHPEVLAGWFVSPDLKEGIHEKADFVVGLDYLSGHTIEAIKRDYPQVAVINSIDSKDNVMERVEKTVQAKADGVQLKPMKDFVEGQEFEKEKDTLKDLRARYPHLMIVGAGGIFEQRFVNVKKMGIVPALAFPSAAELPQKARGYRKMADEINFIPLLAHPDMREEDIPQDTDVLMILGNEDLNVFGKILELKKKGIGRYLVIAGGMGRLTQDLIAAAAREHYTAIGNNEAEMIRSIMMQMVEEYMARTERQERMAWQRVLDDLKDKNLTRLESKSAFTVDNFRNSKELLSDLLPQPGGKPLSILFIQKPIQQLRTKGNFCAIFEREIAHKQVKGISFTIDYAPDDKMNEEIVGELFRMIIHGQKGAWKVDGGYGAIADHLWQRAASIFEEMTTAAKDKLALDLWKNAYNINKTEAPHLMEAAAFMEGLTGGARHLAETIIAHVRDRDLCDRQGISVSGINAAMANGGIDFNKIQVKHSGHPMHWQFDKAQLSALEKDSFEGLSLFVVSVQKAASPLELL